MDAPTARNSILNTPVRARIAGTALVLFCGCFLLYTLLGTRLKNTAAAPFTSCSDVLFQMDVPRVITDMTDFHGDHSRAKVHPLYVLFVNPLGVFLNQTFKGHTVLWAVALNAAFASASVTLAFLLFRLMAGGTLKALLLSLIFAFSASHLILSIIPETASLATLSLLATYAVFWVDLYRRRLPLSVWAACGVCAFGATTTNLAQTCICFAAARLFVPKALRGRALVSAASFAGLILAASIILTLVQKAIYPSASLFFQPSAYVGRFEYASLYVLQHPLEVGSQLFRHFLVANVVAPLPKPVDVHWPLTGITFSTSWSFSLAGCGALAVWTVLALGRCEASHFRTYARFYAGLGLCVLANLALHSFYGIEKTGAAELFLYTGNFTFAVIALCLTRYLSAARRFATVGLTTLFLLVAINSLTVVHRIVDFFDHAKLIP